MICRGISLRRSARRSAMEYDNERRHLPHHSRDQLSICDIGTAVASGVAPDAALATMADLHFAFHQYPAGTDQSDQSVHRQLRQRAAVILTGSGSRQPRRLCGVVGGDFIAFVASRDAAL